MYMVLGGLVAATATISGWVLYQRMSTGKWQAPRGEFFRIRASKDRVKTPRVIFLNREPVTLRGGSDDAPNNVSSIVIDAGAEQVTTRGFRGSDRLWRRIVQCVDATFKPFDLTITDVRPSSGNYIMVAVGGHPDDIGIKSRHIGGLAPFNGEVIGNAVVFAFSRALRNNRRAVCNTIAMEVAHAYGLDHAYDCSDVMTYLPDCGPKFFRNKDVPCGEHKPRDCAGGTPTQNSYRHLEDLVGIDPDRLPKRK